MCPLKISGMSGNTQSFDMSEIKTDYDIGTSNVPNQSETAHDGTLGIQETVHFLTAIGLNETHAYGLAEYLMHDQDLNSDDAKHSAYKNGTIDIGKLIDFLDIDANNEIDSDEVFLASDVFGKPENKSKFNNDDVKKASNIFLSNGDINQTEINNLLDRLSTDMKAPNASTEQDQRTLHITLLALGIDDATIAKIMNLIKDQTDSSAQNIEILKQAFKENNITAFKNKINQIIITDTAETAVRVARAIPSETAEAVTENPSPPQATTPDTAETTVQVAQETAAVPENPSPPQATTNINAPEPTASADGTVIVMDTVPYISDDGTGDGTVNKEKLANLLVVMSIATEDNKSEMANAIIENNTGLNAGELIAKYANDDGTGGTLGVTEFKKSMPLNTIDYPTLNFSARF